ncbi:MAG TPA: hypothetical protein VFX92_05885 [Candidatus Krumholzibacteria bacterium]|nr:hypothetical protein [Candidatus Krumholzibacteria bacterium]
MMRGTLAGLIILLLPLTVRAETPSLRDAASVPAAAGPSSAWEYDGGVGEAAEPISPGKAVLYSLLLPGLGDYQLGHKERASMFFAIEGGIWISYVVFKQQGSGREDEYQQMAVRFAGVDRTGHSDDFYATLREYDNSNVYEADIKDDGRYDLRQVLTADQMEQYFIENRLEDYVPWQWESNDYRLQYSEVRSSSKTAYRRADYMLAAAAANRVASAIVAFASARAANQQSDLGYRLEVSPARAGLDVTFTLTRSF